MTSKINRVSVLIFNDNKFVLIFRHKNNEDYYAIPGGGIELNETPEQAAIREIDEELALKLNNLQLISETNTTDRHDHLFTAKTSDFEFIITGSEKKHLNDPENLFKPLWLDKNSLEQTIPVYPEPFRKIFNEIINKL